MEDLSSQYKVLEMPYMISDSFQFLRFLFDHVLKFEAACENLRIFWHENIDLKVRE